MSGKRIPDHVAAEAQALRDAGVAWNEIARRFDVSVPGIKGRLDAEFRARRNAAASKCMKARRPWARPRTGDAQGRQVVGIGSPQHVRVPPEVLAERDAALRAPMNLTASLCGDPLPGRSALDHRERRP